MINSVKAKIEIGLH